MMCSYFLDAPLFANIIFQVFLKFFARKLTHINSYNFETFYAAKFYTSYLSYIEGITAILKSINREANFRTYSEEFQNHRLFAVINAIEASSVRSSIERMQLLAIGRVETATVKKLRSASQNFMRVWYEVVLVLYCS